MKTGKLKIIKDKSGEVSFVLTNIGYTKPSKRDLRMAKKMEKIIRQLGKCNLNKINRTFTI